MKVELKEIIDQLTEAINIKKGEKVSALIDEGKIVGWVIVKVNDDGTIKPINDTVYKDIRSLFLNHL
jgi:hypothetical protein